MQPVTRFCFVSWVEGSPTTNRLQKKVGALILTEDLAILAGNGGMNLGVTFKETTSWMVY